MVNPGIPLTPAAPSPADPNAYLGTNPDATNPTKWRGCVMEPTGANGILKDKNNNTTTESAITWVRWVYPDGKDNDWDTNGDGYADNVNQTYSPTSSNNDIRGPNLGCPNEIVDFLTNKDTLKAKINGLYPWNRGGTLSDIGLAWGIRLQTPEPPFTNAKAFNDPDYAKYIVLMTDGANEVYWHTGAGKDTTRWSDYTGYGRLDTFWAEMGIQGDVNGGGNDATLSGIDPAASNYRDKAKNAAVAHINARLESMCTKAKTMGITMFTVVFKATGAKATFEKCASGAGRFYYTDNTDGLKDAFKRIGEEISNLRISK